jgi:hypothetical protein
MLKGSEMDTVGPDIGNGPNPFFEGTFKGETKELADLRREQAIEIRKLRRVVRAFLGASYIVAKDVNLRGYNWSEEHLDNARNQAISELDPQKLRNAL